VAINLFNFLETLNVSSINFILLFCIHLISYHIVFWFFCNLIIFTQKTMPMSMRLSIYKWLSEAISAEKGGCTLTAKYEPDMVITDRNNDVTKWRFSILYEKCQVSDVTLAACCKRSCNRHLVWQTSGSFEERTQHRKGY